MSWYYDCSQNDKKCCHEKKKHMICNKEIKHKHKHKAHKRKEDILVINMPLIYSRIIIGNEEDEEKIDCEE